MFLSYLKNSRASELTSMRAKGKQLGGSVSLLKVRDEHCAVECIGIRWQRCAYGARLNREQVKKKS